MEKKFNTLEELKKVLSKEQYEIFTFPIEKKVVVAAKGSGKSFPSSIYDIYTLERDMYANSIKMRQKQTKGSKRLGDGIFKAINYLKQKGYTFNLPYEVNGMKVMKVKNKIKNKLLNQYIEFGSFEDLDGFSGFEVANGGYVANITMDEIVIKGMAPPDREVWESDYFTIVDSIRRHWMIRRDNFNKQQNGVIREPLPFSVMLLMNNWNNHPEIEDANYYFPEDDFVDEVLGFKLSDVLGNKPFIDDNWETIKNNLISNHTRYKIVRKDPFGKTVNTLYARMTKFANPSNSDEYISEILDNIYYALVNADERELCILLGTRDDEFSGEDRAIIPAQTEFVECNESDGGIKGFSIGWDHDANRGPAYTLSCVVSDNTGQDRVMPVEMGRISAYGKGHLGINTRAYHNSMVDIVNDIIKRWYIKERLKDKSLKYGMSVVFDDDDGSYAINVAEKLPSFVGSYILPNKNGVIETGGFGVDSRNKMIEVAASDGRLIFRKEDNIISFVNNVLLKYPTGNNGIGRSKKGVWGKWNKDAMDSFDYSLHPWISILI